ncbi:hypothetical protein Aduo_007768 [Ancylostoma duodenale]
MERSNPTPNNSSDDSKSFIEAVSAIPPLVRFTILTYIFFFVFTALTVPLICRPDMAMDCHEAVSNKERFLILYHLNKLRNDVASGRQKTVKGRVGKMPTAEAMYQLKWSCTLQEQSRQRGAKSSKLHELEAGPNVYEYMEVSSASLPDVVENVVTDARSKFVDLESLPNMEKQLLSDTYTHVGCTISKKKGVQKFICIFDSMVEPVKKLPEAYKTGPPGSRCPKTSLEPGMVLCLWIDQRKGGSKKGNATTPTK